MVKTNQMVSISMENKEHLKDIENKSELVDKLLTDHFNTNKPMDVQLLELAQLSLMAEAQKKAESLSISDMKGVKKVLKELQVEFVDG